MLINFNSCGKQSQGLYLYYLSEFYLDVCFVSLFFLIFISILTLILVASVIDLAAMGHHICLIIMAVEKLTGFKRITR